jgi:hypothetical protein
MNTKATRECEPAPAVWSFAAIDGKAYVGVVAKRAYRTERQCRATVIGDVEVHRSLEVESGWGPAVVPGPDAESDLLGLMKPMTDVLLSGAAHAPGGSAKVVDTSLRVGPVVRHVRAWGPRTLSAGPYAPCFQEPEPFSSIPLTWADAFGGVAGAGRREGKRRVAYPRNPFGRGFRAIEAEPSGTESPVELGVPRLEDPRDAVLPEHLAPTPAERWAALPLPAGYGPIHLFTFPRSAFFLRSAPDRAFGAPREVALGAIQEEDLWFEGTRPPSPRGYNCAPPGQAIARLTGRERVELLNLHPVWPELSFDLPDDVPRLFIDLPGVGVRELAATLATVWIEPELDRVTLTWAGKMEVAWPYPEEDTEAMPCRVVWARSAGS